MSYKTEIKDNVLKIILLEEPNRLNIKDIESECKNKQNIDTIFLDLKNCEFIQSKSIATLISLKKSAQKIGCNFVLTNVEAGIYEVLELMNLINEFKIERDFSTYSIEELINFFNDAEVADNVSEYLAAHYYEDDIDKKLIELLDSDDYIIKEYAILTIGRAHDRDVLEKIREVFDEGYINTTRACMLVLGWFGDTEYKDKIYEYLNHENEELAMTSAASIALLSDENDSKRLEKMLKTDNENTRSVIYQALRLINDDYSLKVLMKMLDKETSEVLKADIVKYISFYNKPEIPDLLINKLDDESIRVREAAASSLIRIKATDKINAILQKVNDSDSWVGYFATKAIGELTKDENIAKHLIEKYNNVAENVKLAIIEALGKMKYDCSDFLYQLLDSDNEDIKKEVLSAMFNLNKKLAAEAAKEILQSDEDSWIVRYKAVEILGDFKQADIKDFIEKILEKENNKYVKEKMMNVLDVL
jgi:anti-anti-sigma factor